MTTTLRKKMAIAHSYPELSETHDLFDHLLAVSNIAKTFSINWKGETWSENAGLLHDFGKFSPDFQKYILSHGATKKVDHATAGAIHACKILHPSIGRLLSYIITGHHTGLPNFRDLNERLAKKHLYSDALLGNPPKELFSLCSPPMIKGNDIDLSLFIRMIFSTLIDADRLDTEAFLSRDKAIIRENYKHITMTDLVKRLDKYLIEKMNNSPVTKINELRKDVLKSCNDAAINANGLFSLTGPLGFGKTLSGLSFALRHAEHLGLSRVIYVAPYTSVIEQTADVFREAIGDVVLEHHSNLDESKKSQWHKLATENWDASIVVTTAVQFFESIFSANPSRCRKIHRVTNAVILLDEAHLMPTDFMLPIIRMLNELMARYNSSVVLMSATQPALDPRSGFDGLKGLNGRTEIIKNFEVLRKTIKRLKVELPKDLHTPLSWDLLSKEIKNHSSVMCIVNSRRDAYELYKLMPKGTYHLSALMCGEHRTEIIKRIKKRLREGKVVRLVTTQLVETGVDIDFPVVYRAMAGLDSLAQASGRCNREGKVDCGRFIVFIPPKKPKIDFLRITYDLTIGMLSRKPEDLFSAEMFLEYYENLYFLKGNLDKHEINNLLPKLSPDIEFKTASEKFQIINDFKISIAVPWRQKGKKLIDELILAASDEAKISKSLYRRVQRYTVAITEKQVKELNEAGILTNINENLWALTSGYDNVSGLSMVFD